jgi:hypothetical protein
VVTRYTPKLPGIVSVAVGFVFSWKHTSRRARRDGIAAAVLSFALLGWGYAAQAQELNLPDRGAIRIDFTDAEDNFVGYEYSDASISIKEPFVEGSRGDADRLVFTSGSTILDFVPGDNCSDMGFTENKDWMGCFKKGGIGTGRLSNGQSLSIGINPTGPASGTTVTSWRWAFTAKQNVVFDMVLSMAGSETETIRVYTGISGDGIEESANVRKCSVGPDSQPDADTSCVLLGTQPWQSVEFRVLNDGELSIGSEFSEFNLSAISGTLTCEEDQQPGLSTTTTIREIFDAGGGVQCRRLPNRDGTACEVVPYLLETSCDETTGGCELTFVHGDQPTIPLERENYAFLCEVWWPPRPSQLTANDEGQLTGGDVLPQTVIEWGGDGTPGTTAPGDLGGKVTYCDGITPLFSQPYEPNSATSCGDSVSYLLSQPAVPGPLQNGGTVAPDSTECSLLEAYDDVLLPSDFPDQCQDDPACPDGRQVACLVDSRTSQIEDPDADCQGTAGDCSTSGPSNPGDVNSAETLLQNYELIYIGGDLLMRRL